MNRIAAIPASTSRKARLACLIAFLPAILASSWSPARAAEPEAKARQAAVPHTGTLSGAQRLRLDGFAKLAQVKRLRVVRLDRSQVQAESFALSLFEATGISASRRRLDASGSSAVYAGTLTMGGKDGEYLFSVLGEDIVGKIFLDGESYSIKGLGEGLHAMIQWEQPDFPACGNEGR